MAQSRSPRPRSPRGSSRPAADIVGRPGVIRDYPLTIDAGFWDLIDRTRPASGEVSEHADAITDELVSQGLEATLAWGGAFDSAIDALDHWDLWGSLYLALGGCSDDAYEYARCWVIGRGRSAWERAQADPEGLLVELFTDPADAEDAYDRVGALGALDGEPLLYAAGRAHERLTGAWLPGASPPTDGARPRGDPWEEDELAERFPLLVTVLPEDSSWDAIALVGPGGERVATLLVLSQAFDSACSAFEAGDHAAAVARIASVLDDPAAWELAASLEGLRAGAAYVGGMSRFILGDTDGAATWLRKALDEQDVPPHVRRGLAQIELARGELDAADDLLDDRADASLIDRALRVVVALRQNDEPTAHARAEALARDLQAPSDAHLWDIAGVHVQLGFVSLELGDAKGAARAAEAVGRLTADAPREVPLVPQGQIVLAGALRLRGDVAQAKRTLSAVRDELRAGTCDRGLAEREEARCARASGDEQEAALLYAAATATFRSAGERWYMESTEAEATKPT